MVRSYASLAVGILLTVVTIYSLLSGADSLTPAHAMSLAALFGLMVGVHQLIYHKSSAVKAALGLFCVSTILFILVSAGTRNSTIATAPNQQHAAKLAFLKAQLDRENRVLAQSDQKKNDACVRSKSNKCKAARAKQQDAERRRDKTQETILNLQTPTDKVLAYAVLMQNLSLPVSWADNMEAWMHYVQVLLCELGAALFVSLGLKPTKKRKNTERKLHKNKKKPGRPPAKVLAFRKNHITQATAPATIMPLAKQTKPIASTSDV